MAKNFFCTLFFLLLCSPLFAAPLAEADLLLAAQNWLDSSPVFSSDYELAGLESVAGLPSLRILRLAPRGYLVMGADDGLPPVLAFSEFYDFSAPLRPESGGLWALLQQQNRRYEEILSQPATRGNDEYQGKNRRAWADLLEAKQTRAAPLEQPNGQILQAPLISEPWHQDWPYNLFYLRSDTELPAVAGCEPVAAALLMRFHQWPPRGQGSKTWNFSGDSRYPEFDVQGRMRADFSSPYEWGLMPEHISGFTELPGDSELALGRLLFDLAVAFESMFSVEETATWNNMVVPAMHSYFHFAGLQKLTKQPRATLFQLIRGDITSGYPVHVSIEGHSFVASGLAKHSGTDYYYLNYGWGGLASGWYKLDDGDDGSVVVEAITNFLPAQTPLFREIVAQQESNFTVSWDYPRIYGNPERFRLSVKRGGNTSIISDSISGNLREYSLTAQAAGAAEYYLEARVAGSWQAKSQPLALTVQSATSAAPPQFSLEHDVVRREPDGTFRLVLHLQSASDSVSLESSHPDLFPEENIRLLGEGLRREILLLPAGAKSGNSMLRIKVSNSAGLSTSDTAYIIWNRLNWHLDWEQAKNQAEQEDKLIFLLVGKDENSYTGNLRLNLSAISDIAFALEKDYVLCYLDYDEASSKGLVFVSGYLSLPLSSVLQYQNGERTLLRTHNPYNTGQLEPASLRNFLGLPASPVLLSPELQTRNPQAQSVFLHIICQGGWTLSSNADFIQPIESSGSGNRVVECLLSMNAGTAERSAVLSLKSAGKGAQCTIVQRRGCIMLQLSAEDKEYEASDAATIADLELTIDDQSYWLRNIRGHFQPNEPGRQEVIVDSYDFDHPELKPEFLPIYATLTENTRTLAAGWNSLVLELQPNEESRARWQSQLLAYELQNRAWVKASEPQAGKSYMIYNPGAELQLQGKALFENPEPLPQAQGWKLQGIISETELPENMQAWFLEMGEYKTPNILEPGRAYWFYLDTKTH